MAKKKRKKKIVRRKRRIRRSPKRKANNKARETWLLDLTNKLRPMFKRAGFKLPTTIKLSCGWPSSRPLSESKRRIGECWIPRGGHPHIFISPSLIKPFEVADCLTHELVHAAVGTKCGHKGPFIDCMKAVGLEGKPTSTEAGPELKKHLNKVCKSIGKYPHEKLDSTGRKKQGTRLIKVICPVDGYTARTTQLWIGMMGPPKCPCGKWMVIG
jgi:hypothetical protein